MEGIPTFSSIPGTEGQGLFGGMQLGPAVPAQQFYAPGSPVVPPAQCTAARKNKLVMVHDNLRKALDGLRMIEQHIENAAYHMSDASAMPIVPCQGYDSWQEARDDLNDGIKEYRKALAKMLYPVAFELYGNGNYEQI